MTSNDPGPTPDEIRAREDTPAAAHVDRAVIDVSQAEIVQSPQSKRQARLLAYSLIVVFVVTIGLLAASFLFQNAQVRKVKANAAQIAVQADALAKQLQADCGWYRDVSQLPVATPAMGNPSIVVPKLISDSRAAWHGHGCPGQVPPANPSYVKWARFYHLPVN